MTQSSAELWNSDAEGIVLAAFIRHPQAYYDINDIDLSWQDFQFKTNRALARAIIEVAMEKGEPDVPFIVETLSMEGNEEAKRLLADVSTLPVSIDQAKESVRLVKSLSAARNLQRLGVEIIDLAKDKRADYESAIAEAEGKFRRLAQSLPEPDRSPRPSEILRRIKESGPVRSIPLAHSPTITEATGGLQPGHLWVAGGFSSVGKSAWACNLVLDVALSGKKTAVISAEMPQETYIYRLLAMLSGVDQNIIRDGGIVNLREQEKIAEAERFLSEDRINIFDDIYSIAGIRSMAKRVKEREGLDVLVVDFIQNIQGTWGDEVKDAREVALECQRLAKDLQITVVALSQLSNSMAQQDESDQGESDYYAFKGSGAIKDAADIALMLRRKRRNQSPLLNIEIKKNRHGRLVKDIECIMNLGTQRVMEIEYGEID